MAQDIAIQLFFVETVKLGKSNQYQTSDMKYRHLISEWASSKQF